MALPPSVLFDNLISLVIPPPPSAGAKRTLRLTRQIRPLYCNRISALEQSLMSLRSELEHQFQEQLRGVKARAAAKRHERIAAVEMGCASKIEEMQKLAQLNEDRHSREIEQLQQLLQLAQTNEDRHFNDIQQFQQQAQTILHNHTSERHEWFKALEAANLKAQQATARLDSYLLQQPIIRPLQIKGKIVSCDHRIFC